MEFEEFKHQIVKIKKMKLPGSELLNLKWHQRNAFRQLREIADVKNTGRKAGVLALFYPSKCQSKLCWL